MTSVPGSILLACSTGNLATLKEYLRNTPIPTETIKILITEAIKNKHLETTQYLITTNPQVPLTEEAIRHSVYSGSVPLLSTVLAKDTSIANMDFDKHGTPLLIALMSRQPLSFIDFLLSSGADPNKDTDPLPSHLAFAASQYPSTDAVALLLHYGAHLAHTGALHAASFGGNVEMVKYLLKEGARPRTDVSDTPLPALALHRAAEKGNREIAEILLQHGADVGAVEAHGKKAIDVAREKGKEGMVALLAKHERDDRGKSRAA